MSGGKIISIVFAVLLVVVVLVAIVNQQPITKVSTTSIEFGRKETAKNPEQQGTVQDGAKSPGQTSNDSTSVPADSITPPPLTTDQGIDIINKIQKDALKNVRPLSYDASQSHSSQQASAVLRLISTADDKDQQFPEGRETWAFALYINDEWQKWRTKLERNGSYTMRPEGVMGQILSLSGKWSKGRNTLTMNCTYTGNKDPYEAIGERAMYSGTFSRQSDGTYTGNSNLGEFPIRMEPLK